MIGERVSHFEILEHLGQGGMGVVYKARDVKLDRLVALKFLPPSLTGDGQAERRFLREARTVSGLDHPGICTVYEIGETEGGRAFIAMAYYDGETLDRRLESGPLAWPEAADLARQVAEGLAAAHALGVVHRDVKPGNVVVTREGVAKLLDFGLATLAGSGRGGGGDGTTVGTVAYQAPEQVRGDPVEPRTDLWALGVVLHEMLAGEPPFRGGHPRAVQHAILHDDPPPLPRHRGIPRALAAVVSRALCRDPEERHPDARALAAELAGSSVEEPRTEILPVAEPGPVPDAAGEEEDAAAPALPGRLPRRAVAALLVAGALIALLAVWMRRSPAVPPAGEAGPTTVVVLPFSYRGSEEYRYLGEGIVDLLSADFDGAGDVRAIDPRAVLGFAASHEPAPAAQGASHGPAGGRAAAARLDAEHFVSGSIVEIAGSLQVQAALYRVAGDAAPLVRVSRQGTVADAFALVDEIARNLLGELARGFAPRIDRVAAVTTSSLPAFKAYLEGESAFRRGQFAASAAAFERAVGLDERFALAWYRLSMAYEWLGTPQALHFEAAAQAFRHADRLTERDRRLLAALRIWREGRNEEARIAYREIVQAYPDDVEGWYQLGEVLFHRNGLYGEPFVQARGPFERVLGWEPQHFPSLVHLARIEAFEDRREAFERLVDRFLRPGEAEGERDLVVRSLRAFALADPAAEEAVLAELASADGPSLAMAFLEVSLYARDLEGAERIARLLAEPSRGPGERSFGGVALAHLHLARGRPGAARRELAALAGFDPWAGLETRALFAALPFVPTPVSELAAIRDELAALDPEAVPTVDEPEVFLDVHHRLHPLLRAYLLGLVSARMGDLESARSWADAVSRQPVPDGHGSLAADLEASVRAQIDRVEGRPAAALERLAGILEETKNPLESPFVARAFERFTRAQLLGELGRWEEALPVYRHMAESAVFEFLYLPVSHFWLGEIYQRLDAPGEAGTAYRRFVDLWRDCDPELRPLVELARRRLSTLDAAAGGER